MELAQLMILVGFIGTSSMLFYIIINICLKLVGIHAHEFSTNTDASTVAIITKYIDKKHFCSTSTHGDKPVGLIIGRWFIAYITTFSIQKRDSASIGYTVTFWSSNKGHKKSLLDDSEDLEKGISKDDPVRVSTRMDNKTIINTIETWRHVGAYKSDSIEKFVIPFYNNVCDEQKKVIIRMNDMVQTSFANGYGSRLSVMIAGPSGTGKSQIAKQFAKTMNASICDDFNPTSPGQNFASLIKTIKPTKKNPLVVLIDECDKKIHKIHTGEKEHEFFVTPATDKASWNKFMDHMGEFEHVFVVFTMNSTFDEITKLDPSYTRCGRINLKINFGGDDTYNSADGIFLHVEPFVNIATVINAKRFIPKPVVIPTVEVTSEIKKSV